MAWWSGGSLTSHLCVRTLVHQTSRGPAPLPLYSGPAPLPLSLVQAYYSAPTLVLYTGPPAVCFSTRARPLHYRHIAVTLPSHYRRIAVTLPFQVHCFTVTLPSHYRHSTVTLPSHYRHIAVTLPLHCRHIAVTGARGRAAAAGAAGVARDAAAAHASTVKVPTSAKSSGPPFAAVERLAL